MITIRRVYDSPAPREGTRVLVDRLWPRGIKKEELQLDDWLKDVSPSNELRKWFAHRPERWATFVEKYFAELDENEDAWHPLLDKARRGKLTLLYSARDTEHNNATALKQYLETKLR